MLKAAALICPGRCTRPWICRTCSCQRRACSERSTIVVGRPGQLVKAICAAYFLNEDNGPRLSNISSTCKGTGYS